MQDQPLNFSSKITTILQAYKKILRKTLPYQQAKKKIEALGLQRKELVCSSDIVLYQKGKKVLKEIEIYQSNNEETPAWHSGLDDFKSALSTLLAAYNPKGNKVINHQQEASRALVEIIQLIPLSRKQMNIQIRQKINHCREIIMKFGSKEQRTKIEAILYPQHPRNFC